MRFHDLPGFNRAVDWTPIPYHTGPKQGYGGQLYPNALRVREDAYK